MRLLLYLLILILGVFIGYKEIGLRKIKGRINVIQNWCLIFLLFVMGVKIGVDKKVINSFFELGFQAIVISLFSIFFSVLLVKLVKNYVQKGVKKGENQ